MGGTCPPHPPQDRRPCLNSNSEDGTQLHCFVDSSIKAYGAITYLKRGPEISFVMAKTRVAPIKQLTLPKLELMAALIGARLLSFIHNAMMDLYPMPEVYLWFDSQIVLSWLHSNKQLKQFVANHVNSIRELFPANIWHYCPTQENPADIFTRGLTNQQMLSSSLWKNGPAWLMLSKEHWPSTSAATAAFQTQSSSTSDIVQNHSTSTLDAVENNQVQTPKAIETNPFPVNPTDKICKEYGIHSIIDIAQNNNLERLLRITSYVLRFIGQLRKCTNHKQIQLTPEETNTAERIWIKSCQQSTYQMELDSLSSKNKPPTALVKQLCLFLDHQHLIGCQGRIHNAPVSESTKFPILLPTYHPFTKLVVLSTHVQQLHSGVNSTLAAIRKQYNS